MKADEIQEALDVIDPVGLDYMEWCQVGMALQREGLPVEVWDTWSRRDPARYHAGDCEQKWRGFHDKATEVTGKTIFKMAYDRGWKPERKDGTFGWDDIVTISDRPRTSDAPKIDPIVKVVVDPTTVGEEQVPDGAPENAAQELIDFLHAVFEPDEHICYVTNEIRQDEDGKWKPAGSGISEKCSDVCERLERHKGKSDAIAMALTSTKEEAGAWVRVNPLDGEGIGDSHVTAYRNALVECDDGMSMGRQLALIHSMRLPVAAITTSGNKSVHAVVRIDAADKHEYDERVKKLYEWCRESGLNVDGQNKNPSRLMRMPGVRRGDKWQRLVQAGATPGDPATWDEWQDWAAEEKSGLPQICGLADIEEVPDLAPQLIHGILRDGQKGMLVGPSKAGKSFALIELGIAVAKGWPWIGHKCSKGRVLYINLEIQRASFIHRLVDVYRAMSGLYSDAGIPDDDAALLRTLPNFDYWCLRGFTAPLDKLVPMLVRKAKDGNYRLVIIDPIYKVLTGDENSASDMSLFTNQFDVIATMLNCAVFYAHHHAKGAAGGKASMDRASGSGVFARDPDALLDMSPIAVPAELADVVKYEITGDDGQLHERHASAYRISYTLREFESPLPLDVVFTWPLHTVTDELRECRLVGEMPTGKEFSNLGKQAVHSKADAKWNTINETVSWAVDEVKKAGKTPTINNVARHIELYAPDSEVTEANLSRWSKPSQRKQKYQRFGFEKRAMENGVFILKPVSG